jgi:LysR family transcriptional regulator for bpeEF and oprC
VFVDWIALVFEKCPLMSNNKDIQGRCLIAGADYETALYGTARAPATPAPPAQAYA